MTFIRLENGRVLEKRDDGTFAPAETNSDWDAIDALTEEEIEAMASSDPDHPGLDDTFWSRVDGAEPPATIRLAEDVSAFFRRDGRLSEKRINDVLRGYISARAGRR